MDKSEKKRKEDHVSSKARKKQKSYETCNETCNEVESDYESELATQPCTKTHSIINGIPTFIRPTSFMDGSDKSYDWIPYDEFRNAYNRYQAVYIRTSPSVRGTSKRNNILTNDNRPSSPTCLTWKNLHQLFSSINEKDQESWCIENEKDTSKDANDPKVFLTVNKNPKRRRGYCSFILQSDTQMLKETLTRVPFAHLPVAKPIISSKANCNQNIEKKSHILKNENEVGSDSKSQNKNTKENPSSIMKVKYGPCLWFFHGYNDPSTETDSMLSTTVNETDRFLKGRPEHIDSISHDGTWHYQLSGIKSWFIRPTDTLLSQMEEGETDKVPKSDIQFTNHCSEKYSDSSNKHDHLLENVIQINCEQGDILLINTRLWWHKTELPIQPTKIIAESIRVGVKKEEKVVSETNQGKENEIAVPSISYARDIYLSSEFWYNQNKKSTKNNAEKDESNMTNVDGLYAASDIEAQTIIFTEANMPDCALHRNNENPNCEVTELEDGTGAIVSIRDIHCGEFFCVADSSDEEGSDFEEAEFEDE